MHHALNFVVPAEGKILILDSSDKENIVTQ
jgi:hypothetical protein